MIVESGKQNFSALIPRIQNEAVQMARKWATAIAVILAPAFHIIIQPPSDRPPAIVVVNAAVFEMSSSTS
jgi:hypothetical protein